MSSQNEGAATKVSDEAALAFVRSRFGDAVRDIARIGHGEWSRAFALRHGEDDLIIRFSTVDEDFRKDKLAAQFGSRALPIPPIIEIGAALGGFYAVSRRASGGFIDDCDEGQLRALLPSLFRTWDAMREADLSVTTGYGSWDGNGSAPHAAWREALLDVAQDPEGDRIHGWWDRLVGSPTGRVPFEEALAQLRWLVDFCPESRHLIHSDMLNYNVLVEGEQISAVIDWGCGMYGDFLYDLAWFTYWAPWYPAWQGIDFAREARCHYVAIGVEVPHFAERLCCYELHIGLAAQAYNAYKERWDGLEETARRTLALATRPDPQDITS